jgi:hypothetical protein
VVLSPVSGSRQDLYGIVRRSHENTYQNVLTMSLMIRTASAIAVAWNPMLAIPPTNSETVTSWSAYLSKSMPWTLCASCDTGAEGLRTASVAKEGAEATPLVDMIEKLDVDA